MTSAFNLSQLANKVNTSGQLDSSTGLSGTIATSVLGSGTADSSTFLRGDNTWSSPSSSSVIKNMPLASGKSVTAGVLASINASGEVGSLPVLNTLGSEYVNTGTTDSYNAISLDGSTAVRVSVAGGGTTNYTFTFRGTALSGSSNPVNGTNTVTTTTTPSSAEVYVTANYGFAVYPITNSTFMCICTGYRGGNPISGETRGSINTRMFVLTVDSSGNVTKGSETNNSYTSNQFNYSFDFITGQISTGLFVIYTNGSLGEAKYTASVSGTTITINTNDPESYSFLGTNLKNCCLTTSNVIVYGVGSDYRTATVSGNNIGSVTTTTIITDANNSPQWWKITNDKLLAVYRDTALIWRWKTYSVNQSTGALTLISTYSLNLPSDNLNDTAFKSATEGVFTYGLSGFFYLNSVSLDSSGNILGLNAPTLVGSASMNLSYNTGNIYYANYYQSSAQRLRTFTVNAYTTDIFNYIGVAQSTSSVSPVPICISGVASGFTGLTIGSIYYAKTPPDGTVTTSSTSAIRIGKAISSTEIVLGI